MFFKEEEKIMKKLGLITGILLSILLICSFAVGAANEIIIGSFNHMTGAISGPGQLSVEGQNLAFELQPTVLGRPIKIVLVDDKSEKVEAANAAARLVQYEKVCVVMGSTASSLSISGGEVCNKAGIPMVAGVSTNPLVTLNKPYVFRVCFIDPFQGEVMANFAVNNLHAKTAVVIQDIASDYSVGLSNFFRKAFIELTDNPKSIIGLISYQMGDQDFTAQLTYAASKNPDVIFVPAGVYGDGALMIRQGKEMGITATFLGGDSFNVPEFIDIGGDAVEGCYFSTHFDANVATTPSTPKFVTAYKKKYNKLPSMMAALNYDVYNLILDAIKRADSADPKAIRDALAATKDFEGVTGMINLDYNGDAVKDAIIETVKNGKFEYVATIHPF